MCIRDSPRPRERSSWAHAATAGRPPSRPCGRGGVPRPTAPAGRSRCAAAHADPVRFTLEPFGDLEVTEGATLGECRADLAQLTGTPPTTPLGIAGVLLTEDQVAGVPPWVAGARIESEPGRVAPTSRATARPLAGRNRAGPPARYWHLCLLYTS